MLCDKKKNKNEISQEFSVGDFPAKIILALWQQ
jgi:hypothetical protein